MYLVNSGSKNLSFRRVTRILKTRCCVLRLFGHHFQPWESQSVAWINFKNCLKDTSMNARTTFRTFVTTKLRAWNEKLDHISKARFPANLLNFSGRGLFLTLQRVVGECWRPERSLRYLYPDVLWGILSHTHGELKGERASATLLRQHLRFGTHERYKPTSIGGKAACERERWMRDGWCEMNRANGQTWQT